MAAEHVSIPQAAKMLGIGAQTLREWMRDPDFPLPVLELRHKKRFSVSVIEDYLARANTPKIAS